MLIEAAKSLLAAIVLVHSRVELSKQAIGNRRIRTSFVVLLSVGGLPKYNSTKKQQRTRGQSEYALNIGKTGAVCQSAGKGIASLLELLVNLILINSLSNVMMTIMNKQS